MINDLQGKTARELREIVTIQMEEYAKLQAKEAELQKSLAKCERVIKVPDNEASADDYDLGA